MQNIESQNKTNGKKQLKLEQLEENCFEMLMKKDFSAEAKKPFLQLPLEVVSAKGSCVFDADGKRYIDLTSNLCNNPLGYSLPKYDNFFLDAGMFSVQTQKKLEQKLIDLAGLEKILFFSSLPDLLKRLSEILNSHLKFSDRQKILVCAQTPLQEYIDSYSKNSSCVEFVPLNRESTLKSVFSKSVGALVLQPVQFSEYSPGLGGSRDFNVVDDEFIRTAKNLCDKKGALFVLDCSNMPPFSIKNSILNCDAEIKPDIAFFSKGFSPDFAISCLLMSEKLPFQNEIDSQPSLLNFAGYSSSLAFLEFLETFEQDETEQSFSYLEEKLSELAENHISLVDVYALGKVFLFVLDLSAYEFAQEALNLGVIVNPINTCQIILSPPYNIEKILIDESVAVFDKIFDKLSPFDRIK